MFLNSITSLNPSLLPNAFISIAATKLLVNLVRNTWRNYADSRQIAIFVITWNKHSVTDWFVAYVTKASNAACWPKPNSAPDLALGMEAAERNAKSLKGTEQAVHKLGASRPAPSSWCYRCGRENHDAKDCRFRDATCHFCKKKGHIVPACRSKASQSRSERRPVQVKHQQRTQYVSANDEQPDTSDPEELSLFAIGEHGCGCLHHL